VWFNAALLEAPGVHACAVHSAVAGTADTHGSADMPMEAHSGHHASSPSKEHAAACSCLGVCCGVSPFISSDEAPDIAAHYAALAPRRIGHVVAAPTVDRPFDRPFANGPPRIG
jgi:hypothetical protein